MSLLSQHRDLIEASAIAPEVVEERGYRSAERKADLESVGFGRVQRNVPALVIPVYDVTGNIATYLARPDEPRVKGGRPLKYEIPFGSSMVLDVPKRARGDLDDPAKPLFITEGARKADAAVSAGLCCVSLIGVWCWRGTNFKGGKIALPDFESVALNDRDVYVVFDSDVMVKPEVHGALERLKPFLEQRGARVRPIYLPAGPGAVKVGLDDFLAQGRSVDDLLAHASIDLVPLPTASSDMPTYEATSEGLVWNKDEGHAVPLTNFSAQIVADVTRDDGAERTRFFEVETEFKDRRSTFLIPARDFDSLDWIANEIGAGAVVAPGYVAKEHARVAIHLLSGNPPRRSSYSHLGWRRLDGQEIYLHAGGGIGPDGVAPGVDVHVEDKLALFSLPDAPDGKALTEAVEASLGLLEVAPAEVAFPALGGIYRAPLGPCSHAIHLAGGTGLGKSAFAALMQQHYGREMDANNLPGSWTSTANYLEGQTFAAKDMLLVVDDLTLGNSRRDREEAQRKAERLYRAQGNQQGRGRMRADATMRTTRYPRGLAVGTSEDVPAGQSLRARIFVLEFGPKTISWKKLTELQVLGSEGLFASAMAGYVSWIARNFDARRVWLAEELSALRQRAHASDHHRRTPDVLASLAAGLNSFLEFAHQSGVVSAGERDHLAKEGWEALGAAARKQLPHQADSDPPLRFLSLLTSAITAGNAHLADLGTGQKPECPERWGWKNVPSGTESEWRPDGQRLGWVSGEDVYLDLDVALAAVQTLGERGGQHLSITGAMLAKQLHERGLLASTELRTRQTYKVRITAASRRHAVLHLHTTAFDSPGGGQLRGDTQPTDPTADGLAPTNSPTRLESGSKGAGDAPGRGGRVGRDRDPWAEGADTPSPTLPAPQQSFAAPDPPDQVMAPPCPYPSHRERDWTGTAGQAVCGVCHPPCTPTDQAKRDQDG